MSAIREAIGLPLLFLTVILLGGVRLGEGVALTPPSLFALVLATLLLTALVRSGALAPDRLLHGSRSILANANGAVALATLFFAAAQTLAMLTPRSGLPLFFVDIFLFVLLTNTLVAQPDRIRLLRSLAVILGSALLVKFVVLASLSTPSVGRTARVMAALFDAATFGAVVQEAQTPGAGYIAFFTAGLFLVGLSGLPSARPLRGGAMIRAIPPR